MRQHRRKRGQRGAALVEFALVAGLLCLLLFGIVEMGLIFQDQALLGQSAREGARSAAVGNTTATAQTAAVNAGAGLAITTGSVTLEKSSDGGQSWAALGDAPPVNDAVAGNLIRATVTYAHPLVTGFVFTGSSKTLTAKMVMRRE